MMKKALKAAVTVCAVAAAAAVGVVAGLYVRRQLDVVGDFDTPDM